MKKKSLFVLLAILLVACSNANNLHRSAIESSTSSPIYSPVVSTLTATLQPTSTARISTPTPILSRTSTSSPAQPSLINWLIHAVEIPEWPTDLFSVSWENNQYIRIDTGIKENEYRLVGVTSDNISTPLPMPTPFHNVDPFTLIYSPKRTYVVECGGKGQDHFYHEFQLYRVADNRLISQVNNIISNCWLGIGWAKNESALSFTSKNPADTNKPVSIYVWKPNGSAPYIIGQGAFFLDNPGNWSPDLKRLVAEFYSLGPSNPDAHSFQILFLNGRPASIKNTELGIRHQPGLSWLTNDIVYEGNVVNVRCGLYDYYDAESGEHLPYLSWFDCGYWYEISNQRPSLSLNNRWLVVDRTDHDIAGSWEKGRKQQLLYTLYDIQSRQPYTLSVSTDIYLDFIGWSSDSSTFYVDRRPVTDTITSYPETSIGMFAFNPNTRNFQLLNKDVFYAWLSPDRQYVFGLSEDRDELMGAIYTLDGMPITKPQWVGKRPVYDVRTGLRDYQSLSGYGVRLAWSNGSTQVAFTDQLNHLWLANINGTVGQLASDLLLDDDLLWSPDDSYLLLLSVNDRAWVVFFTK